MIASSFWVNFAIWTTVSIVLAACLKKYFYLPVACVCSDLAGTPLAGKYRDSEENYPECSCEYSLKVSMIFHLQLSWFFLLKYLCRLSIPESLKIPPKLFGHKPLSGTSPQKYVWGCAYFWLLGFLNFQAAFSGEIDHGRLQDSWLI